MNWKQFKDWMEAQGVKDDDEIHHIDIIEYDPEILKNAIKYPYGWAIDQMKTYWPRH